MNNTDASILYSPEPPEDFTAVLELYEALEWNTLNLTVRELEAMCTGSWHAVYAYDGRRLAGMGRVISDGVLTGVICGLGVHPDDQSRGIGKGILQRLVSHCEQFGVIPQLFCEKSLESYYEKLGFKTFAVGMSKAIVR